MSSRSRLLEDFDSHAAAEGLFHPASMIEAFLEHDTKYVSSKPNNQPDGPASGEYPLSREHHKLPILGAVEVKKRERLSSHSEVQLYYADSSSRSSLISTRSDSDLHAPRRTGSVPSSADRSALDFLDQSDEDEDQQNSAKSNQRVPHTRSKTSPPDFKALSLQSKRSHKGDLDLTSKFDALKLMVKANAKVHGIAAYKDEQPRKIKTMPSDGDSGTMPTDHSSHANTKAGTSTKNNSINEKKQRLGIATHTSIVVTLAIAPTTTGATKKDIKSRNGVSLSDLKKEHRAALELLQELGGPIDLSELTEERAAKATLVKQTRVSKQPSADLHSGLSRTAPRQNSTKHDLGRKAPIPSQSRSQSSGKLVAKLRASVPSGRDKYKEQSPELDLPEHGLHQPSSTDDDDNHVSGSLDLEQCLREADSASANQVLAMVQCDGNSGKTSPESAQQPLDESWKQYEDDDAQQQEDEESKNNDADLDPWTLKAAEGALPRSGMSTARSADLYGDEAFENEW